MQMKEPSSPDLISDNSAMQRQSWRSSSDSIALHAGPAVTEPAVGRVPVDRGWAWMVVLGSFTVQLFVIGGAKSFGVLFVEFSERFNAPPDSAAWITSLNGFMAMCLAPFTTALGQRYSNRAVIVTGGLLIGLGYLLSAFATKLPHLYVTYGLIAGAGCGMSFAPSVVALGEYFSRRRALANGLAVAGSGVGSFLIPNLYRLLIDTYSLQGALLIFSALALHVCAFGALMTPKSFYDGDSSKRSPLLDKETTKSASQNAMSLTTSPAENTHKGDANPGTPSLLQKVYLCLCFRPPTQDGYRKPLFDRTLLANPVFYVYAMALLISNMGYPSVFVMTPPNADDLGISKTRGALLVSAIGIADIAGRVGFGYFMDFNLFKKKYAFFGSMALNGVCCALFPFAHTFEWLVALCVFFGLFGGAYVALIPVMFIEALGVDKLANAYGLSVMGQGVGMLVSLPLMGLMRTVTGSWSLSYWVCCAAFVLAAACGLFEQLAVRFHQRSLPRDAHQPGITETT